MEGFVCLLEFWKFDTKCKLHMLWVTLNNYILYFHAVSEIKIFSYAHIGCMNPKTMHLAKYLCTFPYMIILNLQKMHAFPGAGG